MLHRKCVLVGLLENKKYSKMNDDWPKQKHYNERESFPEVNDIDLSKI